MNDYAEIIVIAEGETERIFIRDMLVPYLAQQKVYMTPIILSKPGQKGGDVRFARAKNDIGLHLKQRKDTYVTLFVDYYGIKSDWPGYKEAKQQTVPKHKADKINAATKAEVIRLFGDNNPDRRFIPFIAIHEFEALLFSDPRKLSEHLNISQSEIDKIITECKQPENINDSPISAPSKRLEKLSERFKKTSDGIAIAKAIGLNKIREQCPLFHAWLTTVENLKGASNG